MSAIKVFKKFVDALNQHDVDEICRLMTGDHLFIDSLGAEFCGREAMRQGWAGYFMMVPDYAIDIKDCLAEGALVVAIGKASGTHAPDGKPKAGDGWSVPAAWRAVMDGGRLAIWQVYADNEPLRKSMREHE